jgi:hypothetical protein
MMEKKKAQVWVETVIYTLIGISVITIIIAVATPKIEETWDRIRIEQIIDSLNQIDKNIVGILDSQGSQRVMNLKIAKGSFFVNSSSNEIVWEMESRYKYSEPGQKVSVGGRLNVLTEGKDPYLIKVILDYSSYNLTVLGEEKVLELDSSSTAYTLILKNEGISGGKINIDIRTS